MKAVLALIFAVAMTAPISAQIPTSTSEIRPNFNDDAYAKGALELKRLSRCAVERRSGLAESAAPLTKTTAMRRCICAS